MKKTTLICLPFAGGNVYAYRQLEQVCPPNLVMKTVEPPGRGMRIAEPLVEDAHAVADDMLAQVRPIIAEAQQPYAIYGHSMGALIGYLLTKRIIAEGLPQPIQLIVTGRRSPSVGYTHPPRHLLPKAEFLEVLRNYGGSSEAALAEPEVMAVYEPIIRADFKVVETYQHQATAPFDVPLLAVIGRNEEVTLEEAQRWQELTSVPITVKQFPGNHFFIYPHAFELMKLITRTINAKTLQL